MPRRVFFDWNTPFLPALVDQILPAKGSGPLDLGSLWIVVPTRQSGRRLREALAREWRNRGGTGLLSLEVHPPAFLMQPRESATPVASSFDWMEAWRDVLSRQPAGTMPALFPERKQTFSPDSALEMGQRLQHIRDELLEGGLDIGRAAEHLPPGSERERWSELAKLESAYREMLAKQTLRDPVDAKRDALNTFTPPPSAERLILAGVPDPSPATVRRLEALESTCPIEVWIHAPESEAGRFDDWGRPLDLWRERELGRGDEPAGWIEGLADPEALATRAAELLRDGPELPDLALGLLDDQLTPFLTHQLEDAGIKVFLPQPDSLADQTWVRILTTLHEHRTYRDPESLRAVMRLAPLLEQEEAPSSVSTLRRWDRFASRSFPEGADSVNASLDDPELLPVWNRIRAWIEADSAREWLELFQKALEGQTLNPNRPEDRFKARQLEAVADVLLEAARREENGDAPAPGLVLRVLREQSVDPLRIENALTAEGWLELPYHPAASLLLLGLREGVVPPPLKPDPFLPNGLRQELGLKTDRDWIARDAYLFHALVRSRAAGNVRILVTKRDTQGNPHLPSRYLFACRREEMLTRAKHLFREPPPPALHPPPEPGIRLDASRIDPRPVDTLSVSDINAYLACPTRFYFQRVLGMTRLDDTEYTPDASVFGSVVHRVLEQGVRQGLDTVEAWRESVDALLESEMSRRFSDPRGLATRVFHRGAKARILAAVPIHVDLRNQGWRTLALEEKLSRNCDGFTVTGIIDRIEQHPEHGLMLIDMKTSDTAKRPGQIHLGPAREGRETLQVEVKGKTRQWTNLQLPLYRWLFRKSPHAPDPDTPLTVAYLNLPKAVTDTALEPWKEEAGLAEDAEQALKAVLHHIRNGDWHPTTPNPAYDNFEPLLHHGSDWVKAGAGAAERRKVVE